MNKSNQIKEIVEEIQRVVPSVMELKFGCKIQRYIGVIDTFVKLESFPDGGFVIHLLKQNGKPLSYGLTRDEFENIRILGREITLQDLLLVINEKGYEDSYTPRVSLVYSINAVKNGIEIGDHNYYDLTKSFLENLENDEFREFIYQLICK